MDGEVPERTVLHRLDVGDGDSAWPATFDESAPHGAEPALGQKSPYGAFPGEEPQVLSPDDGQADRIRLLRHPQRGAEFRSKRLLDEHGQTRLETHRCVGRVLDRRRRDDGRVDGDHAQRLLERGPDAELGGSGAVLSSRVRIDSTRHGEASASTTFGMPDAAARAVADDQQGDAGGRRSLHSRDSGGVDTQVRAFSLVRVGVRARAMGYAAGGAASLLTVALAVRLL